MPSALEEPTEAISFQDLPEDVRWKLAQDAVCTQGMLQKDAAAKYALSYDALRQRCVRERWPLPEKVEKLVTQASHNALLAANRAENWSEKGELHRVLAFKVAQKAMESVSAAPPEVKDWSDVERIDKIARRAAGLDTAETTVQANVSFQMLGERFERPVDGVEVLGEVREIEE